MASKWQNIYYKHKSLKEVSITSDILVNHNINTRYNRFILKISTKELAEIVEWLADLLTAGLVLVTALKLVQTRVKSKKVKNILSQIIDKVNDGVALSKAFAEYPEFFDQTFVGMIKAGEISGDLANSFTRLTQMLNIRANIKQQLLMAMLYPMVIVAVCFLLLLAIMTFIIPQFKQLFVDLDIDLPETSKIFLNSMEWIEIYWFVVPMPILLIVFLIFLLRKIEAVDYYYNWLVLKIPLLGEFLRLSIVSRVCRTLGELESVGVNLQDAWLCSIESISNKFFVAKMLSAWLSLRSGEKLNMVLKDLTVFPELVYNLVAIGEETGRLDLMLIKAADSLDKQLTAKFTVILKLIEPLLIVFIGLTILFIIFALFLPLVSILENMAV